jgi:hypothetical protein
MRKVILFSLLIAIFVTVGVALLTVKTVGREYPVVSEVGIVPGLCNGLTQEQDEIISQKIGSPFPATTRTVQKVDRCTGDKEFQIKKTPALSKYVRSWQFYASWFVWSLPLVGAGYVIDKRYENNRH